MCKFDPWLTEKTAKVKKSEKIFSTSDFLDFFFFCFFGGFWGKVPAWTPKSERVWVTQCSVTWGDFVVLAEKRAKTRPGAGNFFFFFFFFFSRHFFPKIPEISRNFCAAVFGAAGTL